MGLQPSISGPFRLFACFTTLLQDRNHWGSGSPDTGVDGWSGVLRAIRRRARLSGTAGPFGCSSLMRLASKSDAKSQDHAIVIA